MATHNSTQRAQPNWPLQTSSLTASGIRTRVLQGGANLKATEAVVFLHGNPGSCEDWADLMGHAAPYGRVVALDMPGFGKADKPLDFPYSIEGEAAFLAEALHQLGIVRAHLVLHDFGGPWGLAWAAMNPQGLASLTLINTGLMRDYRWHFLARIWRTPVLGELQLRMATRSAFHWVSNIGCPQGLPRAFTDRMFDSMDAGTQNAILKLYRATPDLNERSAMLAKVLTPLNPETLVVWGEADPYLPLRLAHLQKEFLPKAEVKVLPRCGHFPFAEDPKAVREAVLPFLKAQLGADTAARVAS
jgi:pimeloyl-ACP methyl ester carboxylesterase